VLLLQGARCTSFLPVITQNALLPSTRTRSISSYAYIHAQHSLTFPLSTFLPNLRRILRKNLELRLCAAARRVRLHPPAGTRRRSSTTWRTLCAGSVRRGIGTQVPGRRSQELVPLPRRLPEHAAAVRLDVGHLSAGKSKKRLGSGCSCVAWLLSSSAKAPYLDFSSLLLTSSILFASSLSIFSMTSRGIWRSEGV
jgi:hypothetical protein